jgi:hypothetical protein
LSIILLFVLAAILSESINLKRLFMELALRRKAVAAKKIVIGPDNTKNSMDPEDNDNLGIVPERVEKDKP